MGRKNNNSFLEGAVILIGANLATKIIGALFKIPLGNLLGAQGMGIFTVAYNVYAALFVISTAGLPVAISKLVAQAQALGRRRECRRILTVSLVAFSLLGLGAWGLLWWGADAFSQWVGNELAALAVRAVAPSLFFVSLLSVVRGYHQGLCNMVPTAVSQVLEALGKLLVGYGAALWLLKAGYGVEVAAAGAIAGVTVGSGAAALYLVLRPRSKAPRGPLGQEPCAGPFRLLWSVLKLAIPVMLGASVLSLTNLIDMALVMNRLQDVGFSAGGANELYGSYSLAVTLFNLPQTLVTALGVSIIPVVSAAHAQGALHRTRRLVASGLRIASLLSLPAAAGFWVLSGPILDLMYYSRPQESATAAPLLAILGLAVPLVGLVSLTSALLQAVGLARIPVYTVGAGALVKLAVSYFLVGNPSWHIAGAPWGTLLCYGAIALLNLWALAHWGLGGHWGRLFARPLAATVLMGLFTGLLRQPLAGLLGDHLGLLVNIGLSAIFYGLMLLAVGALPREDVLLLPQGEKIARILRIKEPLHSKGQSPFAG